MAVWRISQLLPQEYLATCSSVRECKLGEIIVWMGCFVTENTHRPESAGSGQPWQGCTGMHGICWFKALAEMAGSASDSLREALQGPEGCGCSSWGWRAGWGGASGHSQAHLQPPTPVSSSYP